MCYWRKGRIEVMRRRGRSRKKLLNNLEENRGSWGIDSRSSRSHWIENSLMKRLSTCPKTDRGMNIVNLIINCHYLTPSRLVLFSSCFFYVVLSLTPNLIYRGADKSLARPDWKKIEMSPFLVRRGGHCCRGDLVGWTTIWFFVEWLADVRVWSL